jgi:hypothetical protein
MSALGQKQTYAAQNGMSALHPIATAKEKTPQRAMSAFPPKADMCGAQAHVCFGPKADTCTAANYFLFDHLVGARNQRLWNTNTQRLGGFLIDDQLDLRGLLDR